MSITQMEVFLIVLKSIMSILPDNPKITNLIDILILLLDTSPK